MKLGAAVDPEKQSGDRPLDMPKYFSNVDHKDNGYIINHIRELIALLCYLSIHY